MTTLRPMTSLDLLRFNTVNFDSFTETFGNHFYLSYLNNWPELCVTAEAPDGTICGYIIGKVEGDDEDWHGHVTALSIAVEYRRTGLARRLMAYLEKVSEKLDCYFVDLFVRVSNAPAVNFYREMGYVVYRTVGLYYSGKEDAQDMRKPLKRDVHNGCLKNAEETK